LYCRSAISVSRQTRECGSLTGPLAEEQSDKVALIIPLLFLVENPFDNSVTLLHVLDPFLVDLVLLYLFPSGLPIIIFALESLVDEPDLVDVVLDPLETFVTLQERV
jgi:hypothetical protein